MPNWFKVLDVYLRKGYVNNGLTLPFLLGSNSIVSAKIISIEDFFLEMNNIGPYSITIMRCSYLKEYVFGIDSEIKGYRGLYKKIENIYFIDNSLNSIENLKGLITHFEELYLDKIKSKTFSKSDGVWGIYSDVDKERLIDILK